MERYIIRLVISEFVTHYYGPYTSAEASAAHIRLSAIGTPHVCLLREETGK